MEKGDFLQAALRLGKMGFHVFPLKANSKLPAIKDFPNRATNDEAKIRQWWGERPFCNVGISTTKFNGGDSGLIAVDVDNKGEKRGDDELLRLELDGKNLPATFTQRTPTGGKHIVYRVKQAVGQSASAIAPGIDTRSKGGYIVGAGSRLDGRLYAITSDRPPISAPQWLEGFDIGKNSEVKFHSPGRVVDSDQARKRAIEYLATAPLAVEGAGGDHTTFSVAARVKDFGLSVHDCLTVMAEYWNERCAPPWNPEALFLKIENAYAYGGSPIGVDAPENQFEPIPPPPAAPATPALFYLDRINQEYALVFAEGDHFILHETVDNKGRPRRVIRSEASFKRMFSTNNVQEGKAKPKTWAEIWLDWSGRRQYNGMCFSPGKEAGHGYYNTWRGFAVAPVPYEKAAADAKRGFDMFAEHALKNVCGGDKELNRWLMCYFAHLVQKPFERSLTALVFRGKKGTGKNALVDRVGRLFERGQYIVAHNSRYLTSNFNGHLESCLCMVLDEAFWSGEKSAEGTLKGNITAPEILIEKKGREPYMADNHARIVVIGNEDWLVPATADERRYAVFQMGEGRMRDNSFFEEMRILMDDRGGAAVLLYYLQKFDLTVADPNRAPETEALYDQKVNSQNGFDGFWLNCLLEGKILCADFGNEWPEETDKDGFRQAFYRYMREHRNVRNQFQSPRMIGRLLKKFSPSTDLNTARREGADTVHLYTFPSLETARAEWDQHMNHRTKWEP